MIDSITKASAQLKHEGMHTIGNDLLYLPDFYAMLNPIFINKVFTTAEREYAEQFATPALRYASTFCAKEAIYKSVKQRYPKATLVFNKIEILRDRPAGRPRCSLYSQAFKNLEISLSISHDGDYVWAIALVQGNAIY